MQEVHKFSQYHFARINLIFYYKTTIVRFESNVGKICWCSKCGICMGATSSASCICLLIWFERKKNDIQKKDNSNWSPRIAPMRNFTTSGFQRGLLLHLTLVNKLHSGDLQYLPPPPSFTLSVCCAHHCKGAKFLPIFNMHDQISNQNPFWFLWQVFWAIGTVVEVLLALVVMPTLGWQYLLFFSAIPVLIFCICCKVRRGKSRFIVYEGWCQPRNFEKYKVP